MQFSTLLAALSSLALAAARPAELAAQGLSTTFAWDPVYGAASQPLTSFACSDGANGLAAKYPTLGDIPSFPNVAAVFTISGWNDVDCGKCYKTYFEGQTVYVTGVDVSTSGFVMSQAALDTLTGGRAVEAGRVTGQYVEVAKSFCGM
ncbi:rasp f 13 [Geopyxis carbonaria]|nr:rasp f 13 [Geopyxis carbonaria]